MKHDRATTFQLELPASHTWVSVVRAFVAEVLARVEPLADRERVTYGVQLAVHEACTNIIDYAYSSSGVGRIGLTVMLCDLPRRVVIEIADTGRSFDIDTVPEPTLGEPQVHGYGLFLIRNLVDEVIYTPLPSGNRWCLIKQL